MNKKKEVKKMNKEQEHKLNQILYYSNIHPSDTEFINNIIYDLQQEIVDYKWKYKLMVKFKNKAL